MPKFDRSSLRELKDYLHADCVHDAEITAVQYDRAQRTLSIDAVNRFCGETLKWVFEGVEFLLFLNSPGVQNHEYISIVLVDEGYGDLQKQMKFIDPKLFSCIPLVFEMIAGDQLYLVSKNVTVEFGELDAHAG